MTQTQLHQADKYRTMLHLLRRKRSLIIATTFLGFSTTALIIQNIRPVYTASAKITFENKDSTYIKTQQALIAAPRIAQQVIYDLGLMNDPDFNVRVKTDDHNTKFKTINPYDTMLDHFSKALIAKELEPIISRFRKNFSANFIPDSYILNIEYRSHSSQKATTILNRITDRYLKSIKIGASTEKNKKEKEILDQLQDNVNAALDNLERAKKEIDNAKPARPIETTTAQYDAAYIKYAKAKEMLRPFLATNGQIITNDQAPAVLNAPIIQNLKLENAVLQQNLNAFSTRYGTKHPKIISLTSQSSGIQAQINLEVRNIASRVKANHDQARAQLQALAKPADVISENNDATRAQENLKTRQSQAEEALRIYAEYETVYKKSQKAQIETITPAQILSRASASPFPSSPNKPKTLAVGTLLSFAFGILLALFIEKTRNTFLSGRQLEDYLDLPCYALIPKAKKEKDKPLAHYVTDNPSSSISEAVRALRLVLKLHTDPEKKDAKVVTITSSFPNEGKSTLSSWIAKLAAKSGERVILIDADLRRPSIHKSFGRQNRLSLVEYLGGQNKLEDVIDTHDPSGLHIIYGRTVPSSALDLISSDKMDQLIRSLRKAYDLIIIDSPACMAVSDARALERISDQLLYVVLWNKTRREIVHNGITQFSKFGNAQIATVLTKVNLKKHVQFGYGDTINGYGLYQEYSAL